jgi:hypothetical protein
LIEKLSFDAYNIPKTKEKKESLKKREEILKNKIDPRKLK